MSLADGRSAPAPASVVARQFIAGKELVQILHTVIGIRIAKIFRFHVAGKGWESGGVGGKIVQRDGFAASLRHPDAFGKIFGRWIAGGEMAVGRRPLGSMTPTTIPADCFCSSYVLREARGSRHCEEL